MIVMIDYSPLPAVLKRRSEEDGFPPVPEAGGAMSICSAIAATIHWRGEYSYFPITNSLPIQGLTSVTVGEPLLLRPGTSVPVGAPLLRPMTPS